MLRGMVSYPVCAQLVTHDLLPTMLMALGMNIRVSEEWLQLSGADSIHLADGSGVLVQLGVYHELHCLVSVHPPRLEWNTVY
jgi:hypothetical protein